MALANETVVNIHEAKTHFSRLIERVKAGERVVIAKAGTPVAVLAPFEGALAELEDLFPEAQLAAASSGTTLKEFFREAIEEKLARDVPTGAAPAVRDWPVPPPDVPLEALQEIDKFIDEAFEQVDPEDWR